MKEMRALIADQTSIFPPIIKNNEYQPILDALWATKEDIKPPAGTNPIEMLKKYLEDYVNGPEATTYASFKSGAVLKDEEHYYFDYDKFYEEISQAKDFGVQDFVSNLGGFIGIFLGYSMMQIPELLGTFKNTLEIFLGNCDLIMY